MFAVAGPRCGRRNHISLHFHQGLYGRADARLRRPFCLFALALTERHRAGMSERFVIRPGHEGFSLVDIWTGEAAVIAMAPQTGLSEEDPRHTAELL